MNNDKKTTNHKHPKVSVLMGIYNSARYLPASIESVLNQTDQDFEFILVNNGSTDESASILESYATRDSRVRVFYLAEPGHTKALNYGLSHARGTYIARQDTDDLSHPQRFEKQSKYLNDNPNVHLVGSSVLTIDDAGNPIGKYSYPSDHKSLRKSLLEVNSPLPASTWMFRKSIIKKTGPYDEFFIKAQDYAFLMRLVDVFTFGSLSDHLVSLRKHTNSVTFNDNSAEQHKFTLTSRALYAKGLFEYNYLVNTDKNADFLKAFNTWFTTQKFHRPYNGARGRLAARSFYNDRKFGASFISGIQSLIMDPKYISNKILRRNPFWNESYIVVFQNLPNS